MWRLLKFLFLLFIIAIIVLAVTGKKLGGKTVGEYFQGFMSNQEVREGMKDIRVMVGEAMKAVGSHIADEVTDDERKKLDQLVEQELQNQQTLPPEKKPAK